MIPEKFFLFGLVCFFTPITCTAQTTAASTTNIMKAAYEQASRENKKVFVIFHASWCGWCHKMDSSMNDQSCRRFFNDNYVICHLTVDESKGKEALENPGAGEMRKVFNGEDAGLPFWLILDKDAHLLADAQMRSEGANINSKGKNIGCPATPEEIDYFIKILRKTSRINDAQVSVIAARFHKNAIH